MTTLNSLPKRIQTVIKNTNHITSMANKGAPERLIDRKTINALLSKLSGKKGKIVQSYRIAISMLEKDFEGKYGYRLNYHWEK